MILQREEIDATARESGFTAAAITSVEPLGEDSKRFYEWLEHRYHGSMNYLSRQPEKQARPALLFAEAKSVISLVTNYYSNGEEPAPQPGLGRVARYARGKDYHKVIAKRLEEFQARLERAAGIPIRSRACVDAAPVLERALAKRAGLGFFGKSTNLILPQMGSYFFLSELFVDIDLPAHSHDVAVNCGTCTRCLDACPTNAFANPFVLDSNKCISFQTIENRASIPLSLRARMGDWIFGCDVCQEVCPFNRFSRTTEWRELQPNSGSGAALELIDILQIDDDEEFRRRFEGTALMRAKRRGLVRNAAIVAANTGSKELLPFLLRLAVADPDEIVREHAAWAAEQLTNESNISPRESRAKEPRSRETDRARVHQPPPQ